MIIVLVFMWKYVQMYYQNIVSFFKIDCFIFHERASMKTMKNYEKDDFFSTYCFISCSDNLQLTNKIYKSTTNISILVQILYSQLIIQFNI